jgi:4'-phosphopantetheinyl transferase
MPLFFEKNINPAKKLAVWEITEDLSFFLEKINFEGVLPILSKRQLEKACGLFLIDYVSQIEGLHHYFDNDENGKPYLKKHAISLSFSHSGNKMACLMDFNGGDVGVDIEKISDRILRIAPKFTNDKDQSPFDEELLHYHFIWGAKEVLFKIWSKKEVDFKKDLILFQDIKLIGAINKNNISKHYFIDYIAFDAYFLVWNNE